MSFCGSSTAYFESFAKLVPPLDLYCHFVRFDCVKQFHRASSRLQPSQLSLVFVYLTQLSPPHLAIVSVPHKRERYVWECMRVYATKLGVSTTCRDKSVGVRGRCVNNNIEIHVAESDSDSNWDSEWSWGWGKRVPSDWPNPGLLFHLWEGVQRGPGGGQETLNHNRHSFHDICQLPFPAPFLSLTLFCAWLCSV